ncbi:uncharacterized protein CTHT_0072710 [Thermochaetoides thermophila DSM 1495]|uniref:Alternative oxidase n=1 Tax=Chaetomium thermophilum (strain DSM 1495 / CBS 144.50 / IMI 039719) TaxID=759272 RepID=G0SFZ6_CHATD|nr:hypothetical protein CTHT_0072710 [Thermochaetoides thermophila DSM 1495]EGS17911.1 hypothetical protein CTHT_0072710 [Thermochaetoides thermophila DSM 1495]
MVLVGVSGFGRPRILILVLLALLILIWSPRLSKPRLLCFHPGCYYNDPHLLSPPKQTVDLSKADAPFIPWPLARVCAEANHWTPGVVFICDNNSGGIGNIRNYILTCIRYAIEAGATAIVLPQIRTRSAEDLSNIMLPHEPFTYFFDEAHFRRSFAIACPQITIYNSTSDIPHAPVPFKPEQITPHNFGKRGGCDKRELNKHTDRFGVQFAAHIENTTQEFHLPPPSPEHPRIIRFTWGVQFDWPVFRDGPEFVATFGGLLRFRQDILDLGYRTASYMRQFASSQDGASTSKYIGIHLRTESDALPRWPKYDDQATAYLERAGAMSFKAAYLATGNRTEAKRLADAAEKEHGMAVITKHELLQHHPEDLTKLEALTWDQQALIDFIVLLESDYFLGVSPSSFSMNVALKRHLKTEGLYTRPWKIGGDGDGHSWLVGKYEHYWDDWLFMFDSMWP